MRELVKGHLYSLQNLKGDGFTSLAFYMDPSLHQGQTCAGPSTQEVLRACIARVIALDAEQPALENEVILSHLRGALVQFELRAFRRALEKVAHPERLAVAPNSHVFFLAEVG